MGERGCKTTVMMGVGLKRRRGGYNGGNPWKGGGVARRLAIKFCRKDQMDGLGKGAGAREGEEI